MKSEPEVSYLEHYKRFNDLSPAGRKRLWPYYAQLFSQVLPDDRSVRMLDFGCGAGLLLEWLKSKGYENAEGIDHDAGQIGFAEGLGVKARLISDSPLWLRQNGLFDVIFALDVIEHIPQGQDIPLLCDLNDALKPGGTAFIKVPNANATFGTRARYLDSTHERAYTETSLRQDLERCRFEQIRIYPDDVWAAHNPKELIAMIIKLLFRGARKLEAMSEFGRAFAQFPLSPNIVAMCRKSHD